MSKKKLRNKAQRAESAPEVDQDLPKPKIRGGENMQKMLYLAGVLVCALAFAVVITGWLGFTVEEARANFQRGLIVIFADIAFIFIAWAKVRDQGIFVKSLLYVFVPLSGAACCLMAYFQQFRPDLLPH
jgi:hypothetical protein